VHDVVLPTLAVVVIWLGLAVVLAGCGFLLRRALLGAGRPAVVDLWIGLAALLAYLELWSLVTGVGALAWVGPAAAAAAGAALVPRARPRSQRHLRDKPALSRRFALRGVRGRLRVGSETVTSVSAGVVGVLWLANRALGPAQDYDLGLYHASAVRYAVDYGTVTGLANLQSRLGGGDAHLLLVAFLEHGPWAGAASHLVGGLLVSLLALEIATRAVSGRRGSFARRLALLLAPAAITVVGVGPAYRLASPNLDLAAFVLVAVGAVYLAECAEDGVRPTPALASLSAFTAAAVTRPQYFLPALVTAAVVVVALRRPRVVIAVCGVPAVLAGAWLVRQTLLSGYPFFPATFVRLPVGWRVPLANVQAQNRWTDAWARWPGQTPDVVNASWHWLSVWAHRRVRDFDVMAPAALLAALPPALLVRGGARASRAKPLLAAAAPSLALLVGWFAVAPDPRFALAPLWLVPAALAAWALPATGDRSPPAVVAVGALTAAGFAAVAVTHLTWLFLVALDALALAAVALRLAAAERLQTLFARASLVAVALVPVGFVADRGGFDVLSATGGATLGTQPTPVPSVVAYTTRFGLRLTRPAGGADQCWGVLLCVPQPSPDVRMRGRSIGDGFATETGY